MNTTVIITGGVLDLDFAGSFLKQLNDYQVIAVDAGLEKADKLGIMPDAVVGDFDTVDRNILNKYQENPSILWDVHKPEKDETDTELAFSTALKMGSQSIIMLGGMGGRMDHTLSNIQLLYICLEQNIPACLVDPQNKIYLIKDETSFSIDSVWGSYISFIPFSDEIKGLTLTGFKYPLTNKYLRKGRDAGLCVSNELTKKQGNLSLSAGILICVESKD